MPNCVIISRQDSTSDESGFSTQISFVTTWKFIANSRTQHCTFQSYECYNTALAGACTMYFYPVCGRSLIPSVDGIPGVFLDDVKLQVATYFKTIKTTRNYQVYLYVLEASTAHRTPWHVSKTVKAHLVFVSFPTLLRSWCLWMNYNSFSDFQQLVGRRLEDEVRGWRGRFQDYCLFRTAVSGLGWILQY